MATPTYPGMSGVFNNTTDAVVSSGIEQYGIENTDIMKSEQYERRLLEALTERTRTGHISLLPAHAPLQSHGGLYLTYTRRQAIGLGEQLQEGVTPTGDGLTLGTISGTLHQYGKVVYITDVGTSILNYDIWELLRQELAVSAQLTLDHMTRDAIHRDAGIRRFPTVVVYDFLKGERMHLSEDSAPANSISEITVAHQCNYWDIMAAVQAMRALNLIPGTQRIKVAMGYLALMGITQDPWFVNTYAANGQMAMWKEMGLESWGEFEFVNLGTSAKFYIAGETVTELGTGAANVVAAGVRVETAIIMGPEAGVRLDLVAASAGGNGVRYYEVGFVSEKTDILAQRAAAGYKFWWGVLLHTPPAACIYYFASPVVGGANMGVVNINGGQMDISILGENHLDVFNFIVTDENDTLPNAAALKAQFITAVKNRLAKNIIFTDPIADTTLGPVINGNTGVEVVDADLTWPPTTTSDQPPTISIPLSVLVTGKGSLKGAKSMIGKFVAVRAVPDRRNGWKNTSKK